MADLFDRLFPGDVSTENIPVHIFLLRWLIMRAGRRRGRGSSIIGVWIVTRRLI